VALELADQGVTCNAISPGFVWTQLVEQEIPDLARSEKISLEEAKVQPLARQPTKRFVSVEEVAILAAFLASKAAASIAGANYAIDGGWRSSPGNRPRHRIGPVRDPSQRLPPPAAGPPTAALPARRAIG
jgi:3-hydroxybutyrate dehydrogenase